MIMGVGTTTIILQISFDSPQMSSPRKDLHFSPSLSTSVLEKIIREKVLDLHSFTAGLHDFVFG